MFCKRCRYNLKMIQSGSCPECGRAFDAGDAKTYRKSVGWPKGVRRCLQGMGVFFVFVLIALGVIEVRYQREVAAAHVLSKVGAYSEWSYNKHEWASKIPFLQKRLQRVAKLSFADSHLTSLSPEIGKLSELQELHLYGNQLTSLPPEIGKLTNVERLLLSNNRLVTLPPEIGKLNKLQELRLRNNQLTSLPIALDELTNLIWLQVKNNQLKALPIAVGKLTNLEWLDLSDNEIGSLPSGIAMLSSLEWLDLEANPITDADLEHLKSLPRLRKLDITKTKVTPQGVAALRLALPKCRIESDFDRRAP